MVATINESLAAGSASDNASKIPANGASITCNLCLRLKRESGRYQGFSKDKAPVRQSFRQHECRL
jgi:hypothetical protein